jgi:hypothetical protein
MADAVKKLSVRLAVEGASEAQSRLQAFAKAGTESMGAAGQAARAFAGGLDTAGKAANENASRMSRFGDVFDAAEGKIKGTVRGINDARGAIELLAPGASAASASIGELAGSAGNLADVAGTLAAIFLRSPLGLVALGATAAVVAYTTLKDKTDQAAVSETAYQAALAATAESLDGAADKQKRLRDERSAAATAAVEAGIQEQQAALDRLKSIRDSIEAARSAGAALGNPEGDFGQPLRDFDGELRKVEESSAKVEGRLADLQRRLALVSPDALELGVRLEAVRAELEGLGAAKPTALEALNADFARVKATLDAGLAEGLRLTREEYDALLATAAKRRDLGIAAVLEDEAIRVQAASNALFASLQEVIDREQTATNARQRSGADIEARIDAYSREAAATRAGADALAEFRREQEEGRVRAEAFSQALQAYPDDLEAIQGAVDRTVEAWRRLKEAQDSVPAAKSDTDKLRESIDGLGAGFERAGRRSSRALADMLFGLDKARFSVQNFLAQIGSDIAEGLIRKRITDPITSGLSGIFDNLFADGAAFDRGRVTAFARGGIVDKPTLFPMANGMGLMGEAGEEAVMPLKRLGDGKLGVRAEIETRAAPAAGVTVNVYDNRTSRDSSSVAVTERRAGDGSRQIDVLIEDKIDAALAGGRFDPAMKSRYGARQTVKRT